jgi:hypothetical protein
VLPQHAFEKIFIPHGLRHRMFVEVVGVTEIHVAYQRLSVDRILLEVPTVDGDAVRAVLEALECRATLSSASGCGAIGHTLDAGRGRVPRWVRPGVVDGAPGRHVMCKKATKFPLRTRRARLRALGARTW